ncbi:Smr/MutS family protein [Porphyrobacter sp. LM 6]|uniref:Smr/MutS family protein n=1 Tax=Porphyrobacter sp. LM 6 TaxID=1896196 RepID=UPI000863824D|nr:Smr/MutS family protein [Porphyrobacter sp. LM 6]AOL95787.1 DNA-nicking endonuclease, Smr domain [Porphyrobacter sp. LM 6]
MTGPVRGPSGLSKAEQAAWAHLAASVTPMPGRKRPKPPAPAEPARKAVADTATAPSGKPPAPPKAQRPPRTVPGVPPAPTAPGLDSHWDRRVKAGRLEPELTLDLHGHTLDTAYDRIMAGLDQARAMGARVVLVVAGRERPVDPADRMAKRGAIRAKLLDWLAASRHANAISAVRRAHIRHGGEGALYLILKRTG